MAKTNGKSQDVMLLGVAKENINPPLEGREVISPRQNPTPGIASDLYARAMVFGTPGEDKPQAAMVVLDVLHSPLEIVRAIRDAAAKLVPGLSPETVMVVATHTHTSGVLRPFNIRAPGWGSRVALQRIGQSGDIAQPDPEWIEKVVNGAAQAVARAWQGRGQVRAEIGLTEARFGTNRRVVDTQGKATNDWCDPDGRHTGFFDPSLRFVVFRNAADKRVRAILEGYGCHPVTLGPDNWRFSADYPGYLVRKLEADTKAELAVHITTGGANINPRLCLTSTPEASRTMGEALADAVQASLKHTKPLRTLPLACASVAMELEPKPDLGAYLHELLAARLSSPGQKTFTTEVQAIRLGDLALVSAPGELFAELVVAVQNLSPLPHTLIVGHANDTVGYLCTDTAIREGGYEANSGATSHSAERPYLAAAIAVLDKVRAGN